MNLLFEEIEKFKIWADQHYTQQHETLGGEWECDYDKWTDIYDSFTKWQARSNAEDFFNKQLLDDLIYIIARDNEMSYIADNLNENLLQILIQQTLNNHSSSNEAKWQLAIQMHRLSEKEMVFYFLEKYINENDEYVVRRTLMEMANVNHPKTEYYCEKLWKKDIYGKMEEYQRIAILTALHHIKSKKLKYYLDLAKDDGRKYLVLHANKINTEYQLNDRTH